MNLLWTMYFIVIVFINGIVVHTVYSICMHINTHLLCSPLEHGIWFQFFVLFFQFGKSNWVSYNVIIKQKLEHNIISMYTCNTRRPMCTLYIDMHIVQMNDILYDSNKYWVRVFVTQSCYIYVYLRWAWIPEQSKKKTNLFVLFLSLSFAYALTQTYILIYVGNSKIVDVFKRSVYSFGEGKNIW